MADPEGERRSEPADIPVDLEALGRRLVERSAGDVDTRAIIDAAGPMLSRLPEDLQSPLRDLVSLLADHLGQTAAIVRMHAQRIEDARQAREARLRIDPLPAILAKQGSPLTQPRRVGMAVDDGAFRGYNWHRLEKNAVSKWRWAWPSLVGSVILPRVRGGAVEVGIKFVMPFAMRAGPATLSAMIDGVPVVFHECGTGEWIGSATLLDDPAATRMVLTIFSQGHNDPAKGPNREHRTLGIGLSAVWVEHRSA